MAKLRGKAKRDFLQRMAKGRRAAARKRNTTKTGAARGARKKARAAAASTRRRRRTSRKRNPELLTINPAKRELAKAVREYTRFHGVKPKRATKLGKGRGVLVALGELREIVYQPRRGSRKGPAWFHKFRPGNVLAVTADGKRLVIVDRKNRKAVDFDYGIVN